MILKKILKLLNKLSTNPKTKLNSKILSIIFTNLLCKIKINDIEIEKIKLCQNIIENLIFHYFIIFEEEFIDFDKNNFKNIFKKELNFDEKNIKEEKNIEENIFKKELNIEENIFNNIKLLNYNEFTIETISNSIILDQEYKEGLTNLDKKFFKNCDITQLNNYLNQENKLHKINIEKYIFEVDKIIKKNELFYRAYEIFQYNIINDKKKEIVLMITNQNIYFLKKQKNSYVVDCCYRILDIKCFHVGVFLKDVSNVWYLNIEFQNSEKKKDSFFFTTMGHIDLKKSFLFLSEISFFINFSKNLTNFLFTEDFPSHSNIQNVLKYFL
jgi:hypothetical protein